jgi:hypothetical protein
VLAVLFDLNPRETGTVAPPRVTPPTPAPEPPAAPPPRAGTEQPRQSASIGIAVSGGAAYGLLGSALVGTLSGAVRPRLGHFELALGGLWAPNRSVDYPPGRVLMSLLAGRIQGCAWLRPDVARPDLGLCAGLLAGSLRASGDGYLYDFPVSNAWFAFEASGEARLPLSRNAALQLSISLAVPTRQQSFTVENAGVAAESSPVAGLLGVGPELRFP